MIRLAIDFGTSYTCAALDVDGQRTLLTIDGSPRLPSMVCLADDGRFVVGAAAENQAALMPERLERAPKLRLGTSELLLGGRPVRVTEMVAAVLETVRAEAERHVAGRPIDRVWLTHPASWGQARKQALTEAAALVGIASPWLVAEPEAAAWHFAEARLAPGQRVAVYDLGGGTFDTAVLERTAHGLALVGRPMGKSGLGGEAFDQRLYEWLGRQLAEEAPDAWQRLESSDEKVWRHARADFRADVRRAKEMLSRYPSTSIYLREPVGRELRISREEFEELIQDQVDESVAILRETIAGAELEPSELAAIYLAGGSSRIPLVAAALEDAFGRIDTRDDPKTVVALGALGIAAAHEAPAPAPEPEPLAAPRVAPPPPPAAAQRWWKRGPAIATATVCALLLMGGLAWAIGGGEPDPSPPTPTATATPTATPTETVVADDWTAEEDALYAELDAIDCEPMDSDDALARLDCEVDGYPVIYTSFEYADDMGNYFADPSSTLPEGSCESEWDVRNTWAEGDLTAGDLACYIDDEGDAVIEWTHDDLLIHAFMWTGADDSAGLYDAWLNAGP